MEIILFIAIIIGILKGLETINLTRGGYLPSAKPSNSLIEFTFLNR